MTNEVCICGCDADEHHLTRRLRLQLEAMGYTVFVTEHCEHRFDVVATIHDRLDNQVQDDINKIYGVAFEYEFKTVYNVTRVTCKVIL